MKKFKLLLKDLYYLVKTRKVFFMLMCLGQIVSICIVLILTGVIQMDLSENHREWYENEIAFNVHFDEPIEVGQWIKASENMKQWLGSDFISMIQGGKCENEDREIESIYPGESFKKQKNSKDNLTYEQWMGKDKIVRYSLYEELPENDYYEYGGEKYKIVARANFVKSLIPMRALPDNFKVEYTELYINGMISNKRIEQISDRMRKLFKTDLKIEVPKGIDLMGIQNNNMVILGTIIAIILSVLNLFVCYYYIFDKRKKWLIITRITGCSKRKSIGIYIGEMLIITCVNVSIGLAIFYKFIYSYMVHRKNFYRDIYDIKIYIYCATRFIGFSVITAFIGTLSTTGKSIIDLKKK